MDRTVSSGNTTGHAYNRPYSCRRSGAGGQGRSWPVSGLVWYIMHNGEHYKGLHPLRKAEAQMKNSKGQPKRLLISVTHRSNTRLRRKIHPGVESQNTQW